MKPELILYSAIALGSLHTITACDSGGSSAPGAEAGPDSVTELGSNDAPSEDEAASDDGAPGDAIPPSSDGAGSGEPAGDGAASNDAASSADQVDLTDPRPRVVTSDCGTLPVSAAAFSTSINSPTAMQEGQLIQGRINPDLADNTRHYWTIDLPAGYHHIFIDAERISEQAGPVVVRVNTVDPAGSALTELSDGVALGEFRARHGELFIVDAPRTYILRFETGGTGPFTPQDYVAGIFANGRSVPSPFFTNCPDVTDLSTGTTAAFRLDAFESADDAANLRINLEEGNYRIDTQAARTDGQAGQIAYDIIATEDYGVTRDGELMDSVSNTGTVLSNASGTFTRTEAGPLLLTVKHQGGNVPYDMELTLIRIQP